MPFPFSIFLINRQAFIHLKRETNLPIALSDVLMYFPRHIVHMYFLLNHACNVKFLGPYGYKIVTRLLKAK